MLVNCVAYQDGRKVADIPKEEISEYVKRPGCFVWVALKDPTPRSSTRWRRSSTCTRSRSRTRATATSARRSRSTATRSSPCCTWSSSHGDELDDAARSTSSSGRNYVLSVRHGTEHGFQAVRERAEREPELLKHGSGFVFYALDGQRGRPLLPDGRRARGGAGEDRGAHLRGRARRAPTSRRSTTLKHKLMVMRHAVEPLIEAVHKLYGGRVPHGVRRARRNTSATSTTTCCASSQQLDGLRDMVITAISVNLVDDHARRTTRSPSASPPTPRWSRCRR